MGSPAYGLAWQLWRRHRWGASAILVYLLGLSILAHALPVSLFPPETAVVSAIPLMLGLVYLMAVFANAEADVAAPHSGYPAHLWILPVRTRELVVWPILSGTVVIALAWIVTATAVFIPRGLTAPVWWPAAMLASLLAWLQALCWSPLGLPYLRIVLALTLLPALIAMGIAGHLNGVSSSALTGLFLGLMALAYPIAIAGVTRARSGDNELVSRFWRWAPGRWLEWRWVGNPKSNIQIPKWSTPARAQLWLEWRRNGIVLPLLVAGTCLLFTLPLLWVRDTLPLDPTRPPAQPGTGIGSIEVNAAVRAQQCALLIPLWFAMAVGCGLRKAENRQKDLTINPFLATRPMTSSELVMAKLQMAALSSLAAWAILLLFMIAWLLVPARDAERTGPLGLLLLPYITPKGALTVFLLLACLIALTWKHQVEGLCIDFTGRIWIIHGVPIVVACLTTAGLWSLAWLAANPHLIPRLLKLLPGLACLTLLLKLATGAWALHALWRYHVLRADTLAKLVTGWLLLALGLFLLLRWLLPTGLVSARYLALGIALTLPLTRLALAPLALTWNRHR